MSVPHRSVEHVLLAICIPTFGRRQYLLANIARLCEELSPVDRQLYVIRVFDNGESLTEDECRHYRQLVSFEYLNHGKNIGSDANIALCYSQRGAEYVLVLGDDDFFLPGGLRRVLSLLGSNGPDVLLLKGSGFERDFVREVPRLREGTRWFSTPREFLRYAGAGVLAISSLVVRRSMYGAETPSSYLNTNLVQLGVLLDGMELARTYAATTEYVIGVTRNNSGGYSPERVFVSNVRAVYASKVRPPAVTATEEVLFDEMLKRFFPQRLLQARRAQRISGEQRSFYRREFARHPAYWMMLFPILWCPEPILSPVGALLVAIGKTLNRDVRRAILFLWVRVLDQLRVVARRPTPHAQ
jgi:glycosyltransferase involved in cell wall biosynthesis